MKLRATTIKSGVLILLLVGFAGTTQAETKPPEKMINNKNKIEELFIWKISDELRLSTKEEKSFTDLFRELSQKKMALGHSQDETITRLAATTKDKERNQLLTDYRQQMTEYNKIQTREFDEIKKLLGPERLAKYLSVKRELTNKVKTLLTEKSEKKEADLPPPKVIEE